MWNMRDAAHKTPFRILVILCCVLLAFAFMGLRSLTEKTKSPSGPYVLSLGGSIAAGVGLRGAYRGSQYQLPPACGETDYSYAVMLARQQHLPLLQVACSGAQTSHGLFASQRVSDQWLRPQIMAVKAEAKNSIATIFIGANDARWIHLEFACFSRGCPPYNPPYFNRGLAAISHHIVAAIGDLHRDGARAILINEYYTAITQNNPMVCQGYHLTTTDISRYQAMLQQLNTAIITGYNQAHVPSAYLVALHFGNHGICSQQPWVQSLAEVRPFHPTDAGQQAIANADEAVLIAHGV
jgi:lysophospholipase L1-like esterase